MRAGPILVIAAGLIGLAGAWSRPAAQQPAAAGDAASGAAVFEDRCSMCHNPKGGGQGPSLEGVVGRKAGSAPGFNYTQALKGSGIAWTRAELEQFLAGPSRRVPGTAMKVTLADPNQRRDIVSYLASRHGRP